MTGIKYVVSCCMWIAMYTLRADGCYRHRWPARCTLHSNADGLLRWSIDLPKLIRPWLNA